MGIIRTQAGWQSIINYLGTAIGALAVLFVYPLDVSTYGLAQFLIGTAQFLIPFTSLGLITAIVRFFPEFKSRSWREGYLLNMLILITGALLVVLGITWVFGDAIVEMLRKLGFRDDYLYATGPELVVMSAITLYSSVLILHASNYKKIVVPGIFQNLVPKLVLPPLILLLHFGYISQEALIDYWILSFVLSAIGLLIYLYWLGALDIRNEISLLTRSVVKRIFSYAAFAGMSMMGNKLITRVDIVFLALLYGFEFSGTYFFAIFLGRIVQIPTSALGQIAAPLIADSWVQNDVPTIEKIYKRAGLNLTVIGLYMYFMVLIAADPFFRISNNYETLALSIPIYVFLGLTHIVNMVSSVNSQVIVYSRYYRYEMYFMVTAGLVNIPLTYYLLVGLGIEGAAIATLLAFLFLNTLRVLFVYFQIGIHPFSRGTVKSLALAALGIAYALLMPDIGPPILALGIHCVVFTVLFVGLAEWLKLTEDFKPFVYKLLKKVGLGRFVPGNEE